MPKRTLLLILLIIVAIGSAWYMNRLTVTESKNLSTQAVAPDYYLENFTTTSMDIDGKPKNRLQALYMAHYPDDDTSELLSPSMQFFRPGKRPMTVKSEKGWLTADNEVILLQGDVEIYEDDEFGQRTLQVETKNARVLPNQDYAETDEFTTIISGRLTITGTGMRAFLKDSRLEILNDVHTTIEPR